VSGFHGRNVGSTGVLLTGMTFCFTKNGVHDASVISAVGRPSVQSNDQSAVVRRELVQQAIDEAYFLPVRVSPAFPVQHGSAEKVVLSRVCIDAVKTAQERWDDSIFPGTGAL
jgi:hypothetical protein